MLFPVVGSALLATGGAAEPLIHLRGGVVDPAAPMTRSLAEPQVAQDGRAAYVVQLHGQGGGTERMALERAGAEVVGYVPEFAWMVMVAPDHLDAVTALPFVRWLGPYEGSFKVDPEILLGIRSEAPVEVVVSVFRPRYVRAVIEAIEMAGGEVVEHGASRRWGTVRAVVPSAALPGLAERAEVEWIEPFVQPVTMNDVARRADLMNVERVWNTYGLSGAGQIVAVADTGLDKGDLTSLHPDFSNRVHATKGFVVEDFWADPSGHGTHVAGSVLGSGAAFENGRYSGIAPRARLVVQMIGDPQGGPHVFPPWPLNSLFEHAHENGARIHSDSWGAAVAGAYHSLSRAVDEFMWEVDDMLVLTSAGNSGVDANTDGVIDPQSVGAPGTAKNVLTVGAAESDRPAGSGGYSGVKWGTGSWLQGYPVNPIRDDLISTPADGVQQGIAAFSSRGPTQDGRTKPDVVAPGTDIISARSQHSKAGTGWGVAPGDAGKWYLFMGGTSMSTPLVAGAAALAREYLTERRGFSNPSAALQKALLVNGARSLAPGQYGTSVFQEIPFGPRPNMVEGWGQVDLAHTLYPEGGATNLFWDRHVVSTGQTNRYPLVVSASETNEPVRVTLAWSDYPASLAAARQLVNDLDVRLVAPSGAVLHPGGRTQPDRINNVLGIDWAAPEAGTNWIEVVGHHVPYMPQTYALVVKGAVTSPPRLAFYGVWTDEPMYDGEPVAVHAAITPGAVGVWAAALYWRVNGGSWQTMGMEQGEASGGPNAFHATLPPMAAGDQVDYYAVALDFSMNTVTSQTLTFQVGSTTLFVHPDGTATWPYHSWTNALRHPQDALNVARDGHWIRVADGVYTGRTLQVDRAVTLQSENGAAHAVMDAGGVRRVIEITADAEVIGFTFRNGITPLDGGAIWMEAGRVSSCVVEDSRALRFGGGIYLRGGVVEHTRICGNRADWYGGGALVWGGTLRHSVIHDNHADLDAGGIEFWGGTVRNCTIAFNHANEFGGGLDIGDRGEMVDNIVMFNTAGMLGDNWFDWVGQDFTYTLTSPDPGYTGCFDADPLFVDADARNFRLLSEFGRYVGEGTWTNDAVTSPAIDMGDPESAFDAEPAPNGGRVNLGAYRNTDEASKGSDTQRRLLVYADPGASWPVARTAPAGAVLVETLDPPVIETGTTQHVHTGWTLVGATNTVGASSGTNTTVELALMENALLAWHWRTNYYVAAHVSGSGTVEQVDGWYAAGTNVLVRAEPAPYFELAAWTGTVSSTLNPLMLTVWGPHEVTAIFDAIRTSQGTPHHWLARWGWTNDFEAAAMEDSDGDGLLNWQEYVAGTHPLDPDSVLAVRVRQQGDDTELQWRAQAGRRYRLIHADDLMNGPRRVLLKFNAFTSMNLSFPMPEIESERGFFWIEVEIP